MSAGQRCAEGGLGTERWLRAACMITIFVLIPWAVLTDAFIGSIFLAKTALLYARINSKEATVSLLLMRSLNVSGLFVLASRIAY